MGRAILEFCHCETEDEANNCSDHCPIGHGPSKERIYCHPSFGCNCDPCVIDDGSTQPYPNVLDQAKAAVGGPRRDYGSPLTDFTQVSSAAQDMGLEMGNPLHHALYMILVKMSRLVATPDHRDSLVDIAGYALTYEMCLEEIR